MISDIEAIIVIPSSALNVNNIFGLFFVSTPVFGNVGIHVGPVIVFASNVTAPVCANARPFNVAPVFNVIEVSARILPMKLVVVSRVAELPILHQTLHGSPPVTDEPGEVISVDAVLNIHTPDPVKFKLPVKVKLLVEQYTPGATPDGKVAVKSTAPKVWSHGWSNVPNAVKLSAWAAMALASLECKCVALLPPATPGGKPVIAVPGDTPTSPVVVVAPVFVTVVPARTE
jgi:hypothetical protein